MNIRTLMAAAVFTAAAFAENPKLEGRWTSGRVSTIQYRDAYTGVGAPVSGNYFAFEFRPDGTYTHTGMIQNTLYNCTTTIFGEESGTYEWNDGQLTVRPQKNPFRMTNSCSPASRREAPGKLTERTYRVVVKGSTLQLVNVKDDAVSTFERERR